MNLLQGLEARLVISILGLLHLRFGIADNIVRTIAHDLVSVAEVFGAGLLAVVFFFAGAGFF
jgi:hypothetical protein